MSEEQLTAIQVFLAMLKGTADKVKILDTEMLIIPVGLLDTVYDALAKPAPTKDLLKKEQI